MDGFGAKSNNSFEKCESNEISFDMFKEHSDVIFSEQFILQNITESQLTNYLHRFY